MEKFAWLKEFHPHKDGGIVLATGEGFTSMKPNPEGYASVMDLRSGKAVGWLVSSTALMGLAGPENERRYVLIKRTADAAVEPNRWQFPAGRVATGELPLITACRELTEEIRIEGEHLSWGQTVIRVGGPEVTYLTADEVHTMRARFLHQIDEHTVEFYYPMELKVSAFDAVQLSDNEGYGRSVALFTVAELRAMAAAGELTRPSVGILQQYAPLQ